MLQLKGYTKVITQESCEIKFSGHIFIFQMIPN